MQRYLSVIALVAACGGSGGDNGTDPFGAAFSETGETIPMGARPSNGSTMISDEEDWTDASSLAGDPRPLLDPAQQDAITIAAYSSTGSATPRCRRRPSPPATSTCSTPGPAFGGNRQRTDNTAIFRTGPFTLGG